jgi:hypothetical protein
MDWFRLSSGVVVGAVELGGLVSEYDMTTAKCEWQDMLSSV